MSLVLPTKAEIGARQRRLRGTEALERKAAAALYERLRAPAVDAVELPPPARRRPLHLENFPVVRILREVADKHGVTVEAIQGPSRIALMVRARQEAAWRLHTERPLSLKQVARYIGGVDHSTALHSIRMHEARMSGRAHYKPRVSNAVSACLSPQQVAALASRVTHYAQVRSFGWVDWAIEPARACRVSRKQIDRAELYARIERHFAERFPHTVGGQG